MDLRLPYFEPMDVSSDNAEKLFTAVLAAGLSRRFGSTKQLELLGGQSLVSRAMRVAERITAARSLLVVGHDRRKVMQAALPLAGYVVCNDHYRSGMASSIVAAVRALPDDAGGLMILLADQPLIDEHVVEPLVARWRSNPGAIVCSRFGRRVSPPVIFPRQLLAELAELTGDTGARSVIERHADLVEEMDVREAAVDIDRPEDIERLDRG